MTYDVAMRDKKGGARTVDIQLTTPDQALALCRTFSEVHLSADMRCRDLENSHRGSLTMTALGDIMVTRVCDIALDYDRRVHHIARDDDDSLFFHFNVGTGDLRATQFGREYTLSAARAGLYVQSEPTRIELNPGNDIYGLALPRSLARQWRLAPEDVAVSDHDPQSAALRMLKRYTVLLYEADHIDAVTASAVRHHIGELMGLWLGGLKDAHEADRDPRSRQTARVAAIEALMHRHYAEPRLAAAWVGRQLGLSERMVQHVLTQEGTSFSQRLGRIRLEKAHDLLTDPAQAGVAIADIAFQCGFNDLSTFYRAFKALYGDAPGTSRPRPGDV